MRQDRSLSHSRWECKYHVVFIPKYRKKAIFGADSQGTGRCAETPGPAEGKLDRGRASDVRSRAHDDLDSA